MFPLENEHIRAHTYTHRVKVQLVTFPFHYLPIYLVFILPLGSKFPKVQNFNHKACGFLLSAKSIVSNSILGSAYVSKGLLL